MKVNKNYNWKSKYLNLTVTNGTRNKILCSFMVTHSKNHCSLVFYFFPPGADIPGSCYLIVPAPWLCTRQTSSRILTHSKRFEEKLKETFPSYGRNFFRQKMSLLFVMLNIKILSLTSK